MSLLFPSIFWIGLPLIAVPLLIHLINLRRQRRIRWAAMQFLLESQQRNKRWIMLKQLLLLLTRMAVLAVLVLMLSHLIVRNEWLSLLGRGTTHHLVLLDDSYSMSDRWDDTSAFDEGKRAIQGIVDQAYTQSDTQLVTLLRFSEAARLSAGDQPIVYSQRIDNAFRSRLESVVMGWETSETDVGPAEALKAVPRLPLADDGSTLIVYLVSDFRARQFASATEVRELLSEMDEDVAQVHAIRCVSESRPNLAITALAPDSGVRAAGVEMWMSVTVSNFGEAPVRGITIQLEQDGDALPAIALEEIPARGELTQKFRVQFAGTGAHSIVATLPADAVETDNRRFFACDLPTALPVLIVDGSRDGRGGKQLSLALAPGGNTRTGWQPRIEQSSFLADQEQVDQQSVVCLLDVPRLADDELATLEQFVAGGGGVAFFVGPEVERAFYNERLHIGGEGLFPVPLRLPSQLLDRQGELLPDVEVTDHPLFQVLAGTRNDFMPLLMVDYYYSVNEEWFANDGDNVQVIARLRNGAPLVVEKRFGDGRVIAQLTKLSSANTPLGRWTNWSLNPAFPVLANEMASYLAAGRQKDNLHYVGEDLIVSAPEGKYDSPFRLLLPGGGTTRAEELINATLTDGRLTATIPDVAASGVYEVQLQTVQGEVEHREFAFNVPVGEGDLAIIQREELSDQLAGVELHDATDMAMDEPQLAGMRMGDALLVALIVFLLIEQGLAYIASYHLQPAGGHRQ